MEELSEELTIELFCLITENQPQLDYFKVNLKNNEIEYSTFRSGAKLSLNLDTMTKLMKEWCWDQNFSIETRFNYPLQRVIIYPQYFDDEIKIDDSFGIGETEFEVVLKATKWIAINNKLLQS